MDKKYLLFLMIISFFLLACGFSFDFMEAMGYSDSNTTDIQPLAPEGAIPSNIEEAIPSNIEEAIPSNVEEAIPSNLKYQTDSSVCNRIGTVTDVTLPDGTVLGPGQKAVKTWEIQNAGSCTWTSGYSLKYHSGNTLGALTSPMYFGTQVEPGQSVRLSVSIMAPSTPGSYRSNWILMDDSRNIFGIGENGYDPFWVAVQVSSSGAEQPSGSSGGSSSGSSGSSGSPSGATRISNLNLVLYDEFGYVENFYVAPDFSYASAILNRCGYVQPRWEIYWDGVGSIQLEARVLSAQDSTNILPQWSNTTSSNPLIITAPWNMYYGLSNPYHNVVSFEIKADGQLYYSGTMEIEISCPPDTY